MIDTDHTGEVRWRSMGDGLPWLSVHQLSHAAAIMMVRAANVMAKLMSITICGQLNFE